MRRVDLLLGECSLPELRQRRSHKWRAYPPEVLPAFVAEMDFSLAEPVIAAVTSALALGSHTIQASIGAVAAMPTSGHAHELLRWARIDHSAIAMVAREMLS